MRFLLLALLPSVAWGQLAVKTTGMVRLGGVEGLRVVHDIALLPEAASLTQTSVNLVEITTEAKNVTLEVTNLERVPVPFESFDRLTHLLTTPGKQWVDVTVIDFERNIYDRRTLVVVVGEPDNPPDPDPDPPDPPQPGPFDNLAQRIHEIASSATPGNRQRMAELMEQTAGKMEAFEFRQLSQAKEYIERNWPQCEFCDLVYRLIQADSQDRTLSWQETQSYYREIAKGCR